MNEVFDSNKNPLADIILSAMVMDNEKFVDNENIVFLYQEIYDYLTFVLDDEYDAELLNFDITTHNKCDYVEIKPLNLISGLWFSGIFPQEPKKVENNGNYRFRGKEYSHNKRGKKLKIKLI